MYQDIGPHTYMQEYQYDRTPQEGDYVVSVSGGCVLMCGSDELRKMPQFGADDTLLQEDDFQYTYLFSIDDTGYYAAKGRLPENREYSYCRLRQVQKSVPEWQSYAYATAAHLASWYDNRRYCGHCGTPLIRSQTERAMVCPSCGLIEYPKISPCVIVGILYQDKLLLTRYAGRAYTHHALVAGFVEIGESFESAVRREVMEEVGLTVKRITYYKSQPWAFSESILAGYFAEAEKPEIILNHDGNEELSDAAWFSHDEIPQDSSTFSLTGTMIEAFRSGGTELL